MSAAEPSPAVTLRSVSKGYTRDLRRSQRNGLAAITSEFNPRRAADRRRLRTGEFWAVSDVSFTVWPGDALGIVGVNGAGKSTLLRLVAGITQPTTGEIVRRASVGTLLDVSAGFDPVLTGRENAEVAYTLLCGEPPPEGLVGEILGYADIVHAADHPVRTYSQGMRMRLGFSVMVYVDPDVLVIDEALAVGDTPFQMRCLDHLRSYCRAGGALVFTSHSMWVFQNIATRGIHLQLGEVVAEGRPDEVADHYLVGIRANSVSGEADGPDVLQREQVIRGPSSTDTDTDTDGDDESADESERSAAASSERERSGPVDQRPVRFEHVEIAATDGSEPTPGCDLSVRFDLISDETFESVTLGLMVWTGDLAVCVFADISHEVDGADGPGGGADDADGAFPLAQGRSSMGCVVHDLPLRPGQYAVRAAVYEAPTGDIAGMTGFQDTPWWFAVEGDTEPTGPAGSGALRPLRQIEAQIQK